MGADVNVRLTGNNYSAWINPNGQGGDAPAGEKTMTRDVAVDTLKLFSRTIRGAKVLDGNVIISGDQLVRVSYGSYHGLFAAKNKDRVASEAENRNVRDLLRTALTTYVNGLGDAEKNVKTKLEKIIFAQLGAENDSKPLSRRTIQQLIGAVYEKISEEQRPELQGQWNSKEWKSVGDDDLSVMLSRNHFKNMLQDGVNVAKGLIRKQNGNDDATVNQRCATLDRMFNLYLEMFDKGKTDGVMGAFTCTAMDKDSIGKEMLRQLEGRVFYDMIRTSVASLPKADARDARNAPANDAVKVEEAFGVKAFGELVRSTIKGQNRIRSLEERNVVTFTEEVKNARHPVWVEEVPEETRQERDFIADLILSADGEKAFSFGTEGGRIVATLVDNADLFSAICKELLKNGVGEQKAGQGFGDERGKRVLTALRNVSPRFRNELEKCIKAMFDPKNPIVQIGDCQSGAKLRDALFVKMDKVVAHFAKSNLEAKITEDVNDAVKKHADVVINQIKSVCVCDKKEAELAILKELVIKSCDCDKRRLIAFSVRDRAGAGLPGINAYASEGVDVEGIPGFIRGMGVYANKILQGFKLRGGIGNERAVFEAVKASRSALPPIDVKLIAAKLEETFSLGDPTASIRRIDVKSSCGSGSVAQTFACDIVVNINGKDVKKDVVVKILRPEIMAEFDRQAEIVQRFIDEYQKADKESLSSQHLTRMRDFRGELKTRDELVNALVGARSLGQSLELKTDATNNRTFIWRRADGTDEQVSENNYIGSESLVLNSAGESNRKNVVDEINNAKNREDIGKVLDKYFIVGSGDCMLIECAKGNNLATYQRGIDDLISNKFDVKPLNQHLEAMFANAKAESPDEFPYMSRKDFKESSSEAFKTWSDKVKQDYFSDAVKKHMVPRRHLEKLNRSLLQLKCSLIDGVLNKKVSDNDKPELAHFFQADLHSDNMIFDEETGALTIIDYGKAMTLSDDEANALKVLIQLECHPEGAENGKVMADVFRQLLGSEHGLCNERRGSLPKGSEAYIENEKRLAELDAAMGLIGKDGALAGDALSRELAVAYQSVLSHNKGPSRVRLSMLEIFQRALVNVSGMKLPIPSAVTTFIDSYSRLENALADVQKSIEDVDGSLSRLILEYEKNVVRPAVSQINGVKGSDEDFEPSFDDCGWIDASKVDGNIVIKSTAVTPGQYTSGMFDSRFMWWWKNGGDSVVQRRQKLRTMQVLIASEHRRIKESLSMVDNTSHLAKVLGVNAEAILVDANSLQKWKSALETLDAAEMAIGAELELLKDAISSDSLFETKSVSPDLLENAMVDIENVNLKKQPITREEFLKLSFCVNTEAEKLPEELETKYRQMLVRTGWSWTELLPQIGASHTPGDFVELLGLIRENKTPARSKLDQAPDVDAILPFSFEGLNDGAFADKWMTDCLHTMIEKDYRFKAALKEPYVPFYKIGDNSKQAQDELKAQKDLLKKINDIVSAIAPESNSKVTIKELKSLIGFINTHSDMSSHVAKGEGLNGVLGIYGREVLGAQCVKYSKNAYFCRQMDKFDFFAKHRDRILDESQIIDWQFDENVDVRMGDFMTVNRLCSEFDKLEKVNVGVDVYRKLFPLFVENKNIDGADVSIDLPDPDATNENAESNATAKAEVTVNVAKMLDALYRIWEPVGAKDASELDVQALTLYDRILDVLQDSPFAHDVSRVNPVTVGDYRKALATLRTVVDAGVMPSSITSEAFKSVGGKPVDGVITNWMAKEVFDEFIIANNCGGFKNVGVLDGVDIGVETFVNGAGYAKLVEEANIKLFEKPDCKITTIENPTNADVWRLGKKIRDEQDSQPHLHDDKSVIRNLFPSGKDVQAYTPLDRAKDSFELSIYTMLRGKARARNNPGRNNEADSVQERIKSINATFKGDLELITQKCKELAMAAAVEVKKSQDKFVFAHNEAEFVALRKLLLANPEEALKNYNVKNGFNKQEIKNSPENELVFFQCMLLDRGWVRIKASELTANTQ